MKKTIKKNAVKKFSKSEVSKNEQKKLKGGQGEIVISDIILG